MNMAYSAVLEGLGSYRYYVPGLVIGGQLLSVANSTYCIARWSLVS